MGENPHRDPEWLEEQWYKQTRLADIAEQAGVSKSTITTWARKFDLPHFSECQPWKSEKRLRELYHEKGLSMAEVGEELGCSKEQIWKQMREFGIDRRNARYAREKDNPAQYYTHPKGYELVASENQRGDGKAAVHKLLAIAEGTDPHKLFAGNHVVHHKNGVKWDNRPNNIETMTHSEHAKMHYEQGDTDKMNRGN